MSKLKNTRGFADQFKEILKLSEYQIHALDELEYDLHKSYFWNQKSENSLKFSFLKSLLNLLNEVQINALKFYKNDFIQKKKLKENLEFKKILETEGNRLKKLNLTEEQLFKYALVKKNLPKLMKEKMMERAKKGIMKISRNDDREELEQEHIFPIFTPDQTTAYFSIVKKEKQLELGWHYKLTKDRFEHDYNVQVADHIIPIIYEIENIDNTYDEEGNIKSEFQQEEEKLEKYRNILNPNQFHNYLIKYDQRIKQIKQNLIELNQNHFKQLERSIKSQDYYIKNVLHQKIKVRKQLNKELTTSEKKTIDHLRILYFQELEKRKSEALKDHQKFHLDLVPNEWEDQIMYYNFIIMEPNGYFLKNNQMAKNLLSNELISKIKTYQSHLKMVNKAYKEFQINLYESIDGDHGGWIIKSSLKASKIQYLSFLLFEPNLNSILAKLSAINQAK